MDLASLLHDLRQRAHARPGVPAQTMLDGGYLLSWWSGPAPERLRIRGERQAPDNLQVRAIIEHLPDDLTMAGMWGDGTRGVMITVAPKRRGTLCGRCGWRLDVAAQLSPDGWPVCSQCRLKEKQPR